MKIIKGKHMRTFRENSYDIVRLYINQIGITIFSMFLYTAVGMVDDEDGALFLGLRIAVSIFSILFYLVLVYNVVWEIGAKDKLRIDSGKCEPTPHKGAVMALFANIPNFVLATLAVLSVALHMISGAEWLYSAFAIVFLILRFHTSMYMGVIQGVTPAAPSADPNAIQLADCLIESALFLVLPLLAVAFTHFAYRLGVKEKRIFSIFSSKSSK